MQPWIAGLFGCLVLTGCARLDAPADLTIINGRNLVLDPALVTAQQTDGLLLPASKG